MYNSKFLFISLLIVLGFQSFNADCQKIESKEIKPQLWLTDPDHEVLFKLQDQGFKQINTPGSIPTISIDKSKTY
jgi:hypothetical protein